MKKHPQSQHCSKIVLPLPSAPVLTISLCFRFLFLQSYPNFSLWPLLHSNKFLNLNISPSTSFLKTWFDEKLVLFRCWRGWALIKFFYLWKSAESSFKVLICYGGAIIDSLGWRRLWSLELWTPLFWASLSRGIFQWMAEMTPSSCAPLWNEHKGDMEGLLQQLCLWGLPATKNPNLWIFLPAEVNRNVTERSERAGLQC